MTRYDLTDFEWRAIELLLPTKPRGVPRVDDRRGLNGIFRVYRDGIHLTVPRFEASSGGSSFWLH